MSSALLPAFREVVSLEGHEAEVSSIAISPGGKWLASSSTDDTILLWLINMPGTPVELVGKHLTTWGKTKTQKVFQ